MKTKLSDAPANDIGAKFALEMWKLLRAFERVLVELPEDKAAKRSAQHRYSKGRLDALLDLNGLRLLTFDGQQFSANLPVSPLNADDVADFDNIIIESTIEPTIVGNGVVLHIGKVMLKGNENVPRD